MMTEADLRRQLDEVKAQRRETPIYTEEWASLCYEMGRITAQILRLRADQQHAKGRASLH